MSAWPNKYVIGLTGNIAVGKSVVRKMLQHLGAYTIDADSLGHQVIAKGAPAYKPVVDTFGQGILDGEGNINRMALGRIVFGNPDGLKKLEAITHPIIRQAIHTLVSRSKQRVVVIEAIKLIDGDLMNAVDTVWVINAAPETQLKRLVTQRNMPEAAAKQRISAQGPQNAKLQRANVVIQNDGDVENTWKQVQTQWDEIRRLLTTPPSQQQPAAPKPPAATSQAPAPAAPAAPPKPQPAAPPRPVEPESIDLAEEIPSGDLTDVSLKRGMPANAQMIAEFITQVSGSATSRMDVMMSFGQKSYLLAQDKSNKVVALLGWTVENLVTRMDEFYIASNASVSPVIRGVVRAVEDASKELQSEVGFIFLPSNTSAEVVKSFQANDYQPITLPEIKIPAWREAVEESIAGKQITVLWKQLRKDRVLQPI